MRTLLSTLYSLFSFPLRQQRRGQAIIEVLVAISILTVGFLAVVTLLSRAISLNRVVADNYTATYLAAEGIEVAKNIIDANIIQGRAWNSGLVRGDYEVDFRSSALATAYTGRKLQFDADAHLYSYSGDVPTPFIRKVTVDPVRDGSVEVRIISEVSWESRGGAEANIKLEDHFFDWR